MTALQAIICDFDGVIADSEPLHFESFRLALDEEGIALSCEEYYEHYLGYDDHGLILALARDRGMHVSPTWASDLVTQKGRKLQALLDASVVLFPGAADFIRRAADAVPVAIASGAQRAEIEQVLNATNLGGLVTTIVGAGDTAECKPAPAPYRLAFEQLRAKSGRDLTADRTVAIEDSHWGLESARGAGLRCVGVTNSYPAGELPGAELVTAGLGQLSLDALDRLCASPAQ